MNRYYVKDLVSLNDKEMKVLIELALKNNEKIDIVLRKKTVFISIDNIIKAKGELYKESQKTINKNMEKITFWESFSNSNDLILDFLEESKSFSFIGKIKLNKVKIDKWILKSHVRTKIPEEARNEILVKSKQRCQICIKNLDSNIISKKIGKGLADYAQIAHIEASSFDGPRSNLDKDDCNNVENLMLLCYECHRDIDFINPDEYTVEYLKKIKIDQEESVELLLNSLENPKAFPLKFFGSLYPADQTTINTQEIAIALKNCKLSIPSDYCRQSLFEVPKSSNRPLDVHTSFYWKNMLNIIKKDVSTINYYLGVANTHPNSNGVALFCYHGISELIILGRLIGDSSNVHLFQKHRDENFIFNWTWPNSNDKSGHNNIEFETEILNSQGKSVKEGLLLIEISGKIETESLPNNLYDKDYLLPTIKIKTNMKSKYSTAISSLDSLTKIKNEIKNAIKTIQEDWGCTKVNIISISPTTCNIVIGQLMQDRHHPEIVCYEVNKIDKKQSPTIIISTNKIFHPTDNTVLWEFD